MSEAERIDQILALIGDDEDLAATVRYRVARRFGWTYAAFDRSDVEDNLERPLTDAEWDLIRNSKDWLDAIPEQMADGASITSMLMILGIDD